MNPTSAGEVRGFTASSLVRVRFSNISKRFSRNWPLLKSCDFAVGNSSDGLTMRPSSRHIPALPHLFAFFDLVVITQFGMSTARNSPGAGRRL